MGQITATRNLVATKVVRLAGQWPTKEIHEVKLCNSLSKWKNTMIVSYYVNLIIILIIPHTVMKSRYTNVKYHCEISWYFSVHCLLQSLRNYKEEAKIKPSEKALAMPGQWTTLTAYDCRHGRWMSREILYISAFQHHDPLLLMYII